MSASGSPSSFRGRRRARRAARPVSKYYVPASHLHFSVYSWPGGMGICCSSDFQLKQVPEKVALVRAKSWGCDSRDMGCHTQLFSCRWAPGWSDDCSLALEVRPCALKRCASADPKRKTPPARTEGVSSLRQNWRAGVYARPSRWARLRASLRARRTASAFWRAFFSEGFSKCVRDFISRKRPSRCIFFFSARRACSTLLSRTTICTMGQSPLVLPGPVRARTEFWRETTNGGPISPNMRLAYSRSQQ